MTGGWCRRAWRAAVLTSVAVGLSACREAEEFPPGPHVVAVSMTEYRYRLDAPDAAGRLVFDARNDGRLDHELVLIEVPDGVDDIDRQLRSKERLVVPTIARMAPRDPGRRGTFAVDLGPGRYALICFVQDEDGGQHAQKGMSAEFRLKD